jgi:predicted transcriptional regulator
MPGGKTVAMTFRVTPAFKRLLERAAEKEQRSNTNMLEKLLRDYCEANKLVDVEQGPSPKLSPESAN